MQSGIRSREEQVEVPAGSEMLPGILGVPEGAVGVVVFAHGSGSGRMSPRNAAVARTLQEAGLATLLVDLLTEEEEAADRRHVFDTGLPVIPLNEVALSQLPGTKKLVIVPGATHLFVEPGTLEQVACLARDWFLQHLPRGRSEKSPPSGCLSAQTP